jgi:hypothetical protein
VGSNSNETTELTAWNENTETPAKVKKRKVPDEAVGRKRTKEDPKGKSRAPTYREVELDQEEEADFERARASVLPPAAPAGKPKSASKIEKELAEVGSTFVCAFQGL